MVAPEHRVMLLKAGLSSSGLSVISYHLLGEGQDSTHLMTSTTFGEDQQTLGQWAGVGLCCKQRLA